MKIRKLVLVCLLALGLGACSAPADPAAKTTPAPSAPASIPLAAPATPFTSCRPAEPEIAAAARSVAGDITVARPGVEGDAERIEVVVCKGTDSRATARVTIIGLRDDSIRDTRHDLVLDKLVAQGWVVSHDTVTYSCKPGRGHPDFSAEPCV